MAAQMICTQDTVLHCCLLIVPLLPCDLVFTCAYTWQASITTKRSRWHQDLDCPLQSHKGNELLEKTAICVVAAYFAILKFISELLFLSKTNKLCQLIAVIYFFFAWMVIYKWYQNMNNKDHRVGKLTKLRPSCIVHDRMKYANLSDFCLQANHSYCGLRRPWSRG